MADKNSDWLHADDDSITVDIRHMPEHIALEIMHNGFWMCDIPNCPFGDENDNLGVDGNLILTRDGDRYRLNMEGPHHTLGRRVRTLSFAGVRRFMEHPVMSETLSDICNITTDGSLHTIPRPDGQTDEYWVSDGVAVITDMSKPNHDTAPWRLQSISASLRPYIH